MTNKEWLNRSRTAFEVINVIEEELWSSIDEELKKSLERKKKELVEIKNEIYTAIDNIKEDKYFLVLFERYIAIKTWEQIAEDNHYSLRHVQRLHGEALKRVKQPKAKKQY